MIKVLEEAAFHVVEAKDGEQAMEICKRWAEPIDMWSATWQCPN